jgi:hypothetical protein
MNQVVVSFASVDSNWMVSVMPAAIVDALPTVRS